MDHYILGISAFYHDSSAVLLKGTEIIAAVQEERFTRVKFDSNFPEQSIISCLKIGNIEIKDVKIIAFYEEPRLKWDRIYSSFLHYDFPKFKKIKKLTNFLNNKLLVEHLIYKKYLDDFKGKIIFTKHHISHASSAFYPSPFKTACIVTIDAIGEWASTSIGIGDGKDIKILKEQKYPHSLGFIYSAFTQYLGFKVDSDEYKVMGLAPYGNPKYLKIIKDNLFFISDDGVIEINTKFFSFMTKDTMINNKFEKLFNVKKRLKHEKLNQFHYDIAASIQKICEEAFIKIISYAVKITKCKKVVLAGGVALNCVANGRLIKENIVEDLWIQPCSGDAGGALGAALYITYNYLNNKRINIKPDSQKGSLLGPSFKNKEIKDTLNLMNIDYTYYEKFENVCSVAVKKICEGKVLGFFQDRMEYGPRALGARSIIADPRNKKMQEILNLKIKFRESFRPFAPIILEEKISDWFDNIKKSPYMLLTTNVKKTKLIELSSDQKRKKGIDLLKVSRSEVPAITHIDNSARIQTVNKNENKKIYDLLKKFEELTNCPILINTSFNVMDEPIVCTPAEALNCFMKTNMDVLILGNFIIEKNNLK